MKTHVCLVSKELIPNVLPVLLGRPELIAPSNLPEWIRQTDQIVLLTSPEMKQQAELLENFLQPRGFHCENVRIDAYDFASVLTACADVIAKYGDDELILNVTGSTKVVAIAAYQQFSSAFKRIIYTDTANDRILVLGNQPDSIPLKNNLLDVGEYLACYGKRLIGVHTDINEVEQRRALTENLCKLFVRHPYLLSHFNWLIPQEPEGQYPLTVDLGGKDGSEQLIELLVAAGMATSPEAGQLRMETPDNHFYLHGGWLEEYVYNTVTSMRLDGLDCHLNVNIEWNDPRTSMPTQNELDVLFTCKNRLHVISCKASNLGKIRNIPQTHDGKGVSEPPKGKETIYELDSLTKAIGGIFAQQMLVSAHRLRPVHYWRAQASKIEVVHGMEVLHLREKLEKLWKLKAARP